MPYRQGPYQLFVELPVPPRPEIHSSRAIDAATGTYDFNGTTGGFGSMPSTAQRVLLLISFIDEKQAFVTPQDLESRRRAIVQALSVLTRQPNPAIKLVSVVVMPYLPGHPHATIKYVDLTTGLDQTVQV